MLALKTHIGILLLLVMWFNLMQFFDTKLSRKYSHGIATATALTAFIIIEAFAWTIYLCFVI